LEKGWKVIGERLENDWGKVGEQLGKGWRTIGNGSRRVLERYWRRITDDGDLRT
jgi:hypothetical protein